MLTSRSTSSSNAEPASQADDAMLPSPTASGTPLSRREQLARLEQRAQQELLELRALRDQDTPPGRSEDTDWLASSIDWDLSVP
ncbi:hypothetical protein [Stenotrophomonas sp. PS02298]|uniref:hypothetical protein n=1 Tax=Stenotrophomonas sp. PS02298 TaxID=2991424 RepID=UPI002499DEC1|nr:hypothetical protein [Stenotrophomonas sp. PS02298]